MRAIEQKAVSTTGKVRRSDAMKRAIRRKESPQPLVMTSSKMTDIPIPSLENTPHVPLGTKFDGFDEVERY
jgi:hypothetical protein